MPSIPPSLCGFPSLLDRLMNQADCPPLPAPQETDARHFPPLQIFEEEDALYLRACVPGISLENLYLTIECKTLSLRGDIPLPPGRHLRRDRPSGPFKRDIRLPFAVESDAVQAVIRNGILTVTLPKAPLKEKRIVPINGKKRKPS